MEALADTVFKTMSTDELIRIQETYRKQVEKLRNEETIKSIVATPCDFIIVAAYGQILPKVVLEHAPCINLHASILPKYRGASPIQQALLNGDTQTGVTAMLMNEGLDTGDIIKISKCDIGEDEMAEELYKKLTSIAALLTVDVVKNFSSYTPVAQDEEQATYCKKITKQDGLIEFDDATKIYNKYRAFTPWPGVYLESGLKIKKMERFIENEYFPSGKILDIGSDFIIVGANKGALKIFRVQPASKKEMDIISYINGKRLQVADTLV